MTVEMIPHADGPLSGSPQANWPKRLIRTFLIVLVVLIVTAVVAASTALFFFDQRYSGVIFPNVTIRGVAVGEIAPDDARRLIEERYAPFLAQPVTLTYGNQQWTPTLSELGVRLEIDEAVNQAFIAGRSDDFVANVRQMGAVWQYGLEVPLRVAIDQDVTQQYLLARTAEVERSAVDAELLFDGTFVASQPSAIGYQVLVNDTLGEITAAVQSLAPQTIALRTRELAPTLEDGPVRLAQQEIAALLSGPITLAVEERSFEFTLSELAELVRVERISGANGDALTVSVDPEPLRERIATIAEQTQVDGALPRARWNGGNLQITREGTAGMRMDVVAAEELLLSALNRPASERSVSVPMLATDPPVTQANIGNLGITSLLGVGRSDFTGSAAYRVTNIEAGMRILDGILIAPGEEFSFNNTIGRIDSSNGFVEGYAIVQNRTQLEWGGGICQDSTTLFRAAFWAGLPITERWSHSFYISWYDRYAFGAAGDGPGMDATIFLGGPDLKFLNDTGNWLLMEATVNRGQALAEIRLYGTDTGRTVELIGPAISNRTPPPTDPVYVPEPSRPVGQPRQSNTARGGMDINVTRIVYQNGQVIEQRNFPTRFRPWPNIFEYNPAELGPDGKPRPEETPTPTEDEVVVPAPPPPVVEEPALPAPPAEEPPPPPPGAGIAPTEEPPPAEEPPPGDG